ncbi:MAG: SMI1/KNR4 family protein, partial [bacterium]|nr:SMI1/KNR4 family protein [bacterium]
MTTHTNTIVERYDFAEAMALTVSQRMTRSIEKARDLVSRSAYQQFSDFPCVPQDGATETEIAQLEGDLGRSLPAEYREFLSRCRYLKIDDGCEIGGFAHDGVYVTEIPWVSDQHRFGVPYLVIANYWRFADGDQLMCDLSDANHPV